DPEHIHEIVDGSYEERYIGFAGNRTAETSLAGTRRADEQHAFGNAATKPLELLRILQEVHNFFEFFFGLVNTRNVLECHPAGTLREQFRAALTKAHGLPAARLHLPQEEDPHRDQKQHWEPVDEDTHQGGHAVIRWFHIHIDVVLKHTRCQ